MDSGRIVVSIFLLATSIVSACIVFSSSVISHVVYILLLLLLTHQYLNSNSLTHSLCYLPSYLTTPFHILDSTVILLSFTIDVLLHGVLEEVASLVVILRLWRFLKIVEEFGVGAQEQMDGLEMRIAQLEGENEDLKREARRSKGNADVDEDEEMRVGFRGGN